MPAMPLATLLLLMLLASPLAAAQELRDLQVEHTAVVQAGQQAMFLATCPDDLRIMAGGYKLVASELPLRDVIIVENRPVPERRQWAVTLLYEPPAPAAVPAGEVKVEVWAVCAGPALARPGPLSQKQFGAPLPSCRASRTRCRHSAGGHGRPHAPDGAWMRQPKAA
jgi:hypothetical protein